MPEPSAATPPQRLIADRYEVGEIIGRGGMAEVFAGNDRRLGRQVAVKLLLPEMAARPDIRSRFEAEARAAASLSHPNAVAVFDTGEHLGVPYIIMERLPGETLADRMAAGPVDPNWLTSAATEVLGALGAAHAVGLMHRDVKPGNILLGADGRAKVADFGIAKSLEAADGGDLTSTGQLLGTPAYLAPERLEGAPAGPASDLWALGVVLYEALAGCKPFSGATALATARAVTSGGYRPLSEVRPDLDPALVAAVERAMARHPADRFASAADMAAALLSPASGAATLADPVGDTIDAAPDGTMVLGDAYVPAAPAPPPPSAPGGTNRRRALIGALVAGVVLLAVILLLRAGSGGGPQPVAGGPGTTASQATTTVAATARLAGQLRATADRLGPNDGMLATTLASRLRTLADQVQAGGGGSEATAVLATVVAANRAGQLADGTASSVIELLRQVPGIDQTLLNALTATSAPTTANPAPTTNHNKRKGGKD